MSLPCYCEKRYTAFRGTRNDDLYPIKDSASFVPSNLNKSEAQMADFKVDRALLEANSTEEIIRILQHERDDYTPDAIKIFEDILQERRGGEEIDGAGQTEAAKIDPPLQVFRPSGGVLIHKPGDAISILNDLLSGVLNGSVDPQVAQVASGIVMGILRAMEQEFMIEGEGEEASG
jgi:hypothetical protein